VKTTSNILLLCALALQAACAGPAAPPGEGTAPGVTSEALASVGGCDGVILPTGASLEPVEGVPDLFAVRVNGSVVGADSSAGLAHHRTRGRAESDPMPAQKISLDVMQGRTRSDPMPGDPPTSKETSSTDQTR